MQPASSVVHPDVLAIWPTYNVSFEGRCNFMYLDIRRLVTSGMGNLLEPVNAALTLPWLRADMTPASKVEILAAWNKVKKDETLNPLNGGGQYKKLTTLRLTEGAIDQLITHKLGEMVNIIQADHPKFKDLPADAQLAILSMSWAMGPKFHFPKFWALVESGDFMGAAGECSINPKVGTIVKRNLANKLLLVNAARTRDPSVLSWPKLLPPPTP